MFPAGHMMLLEWSLVWTHKEIKNKKQNKTRCKQEKTKTWSAVLSDCPMLVFTIVITLLIAIININHPAVKGCGALTWMWWHDSYLMNLTRLGWHVHTIQIEGRAPTERVQVKHLQDAFKDSKGGFVSQQRQGGGGGGVAALKLCSSAFRKSLLTFLFF